METTPQPELPPRSVPELVVRAWKRAPRMLRRFSKWVWLVAAVLAAGGVVLDATGWWGKWSFTSNLAAELIGAIAAAPVALLIIGRLQAYHLEESNRPLHEARVNAARTALAGAVRALLTGVDNAEETVRAAANDFIRATEQNADGGSTDPALAESASRELRSLTGRYGKSMFVHVVTPVRIQVTNLRDLLKERNGDGRFTAEILDLDQALGELDLAAADHQHLMSEGQGMFGRSVAYGRNNQRRILQMRKVATDYLDSYNRLHNLCDEMHARFPDNSAPPTLAPGAPPPVTS